jgi:hypothetical protein
LIATDRRCRAHRGGCWRTSGPPRPARPP